MTVAQHDQPHLQLDGTLWWFCSTACRQELAANPNRYTRRPLDRQPAAAAGRR